MKEILVCSLTDLPSSKLEKIIQQDLQFFPAPWSDKSWADSVIVERNFIVFIEEQGVISAWALIELNTLENLIHLLKIFVLPEFRRKGLGIEILKYIQGWGSALKANRCYLEVDKLNHPAVTFYQSQGFKILRENKGFYSDGRDALVMELNY